VSLDIFAIHLVAIVKIASDDRLSISNPGNQRIASMANPKSFDIKALIPGDENNINKKNQYLDFHGR